LPLLLGVREAPFRKELLDVGELSFSVIRTMRDPMRGSLDLRKSDKQ
jgi:hypothetical protein